MKGFTHVFEEEYKAAVTHSKFGRRRHGAKRRFALQRCLRIDGEVDGNVVADESSQSLLVISETGKVRGSVRVGHVVVSGLIEGPIEANQLLELHPSANVSGDVRYRALEMHPGAVVDGTLHHESEEVVPSRLALASSK